MSTELEYVEANASTQVTMISQTAPDTAAEY